MTQVRAHRVLPGFGLSMGYTLTYLSLIVLIPLAAVFVRTTSLSLDAFWEAVTSPRVMASYRLSFGAALLAAAVNVLFGFLLAWSLVRYSFPGKRAVDALVDLPFALPTAVAGISLAALYARNGWLGQYLEPVGIKVAFTRLRRLHDEIHVTSIFVTHDQDEAMEVADRVVLMNRGRVEQTGLTQEVYESPTTAFACGFLGAVNQLPGRIDGDALRIGDATVPLAGACGVDGGEDVIAYARPHDLDIVVCGDAREGLPASVKRVLVSGAIARVELLGAARADGETAPPARFEVELTRERLAQLNLQPGQAVRLTSSRLKVFPLERRS